MPANPSLGKILWNDLSGILSMPPPAVAFTFDLLTPKSNQHIYEPKYICDQNWVKFSSLVFEIWRSWGFVGTHAQTHRLTDGQTRLQNGCGTVCRRWGGIKWPTLQYDRGKLVSCCSRRRRMSTRVDVRRRALTCGMMRRFWRTLTCGQSFYLCCCKLGI